MCTCMLYVWKGFPPKVVVYKCADVLITQFLLQISMSQVTGISAWRRWSVWHRKHNSFLWERTFLAERSSRYVGP